MKTTNRFLKLGSIILLLAATSSNARRPMESCAIRPAFANDPSNKDSYVQRLKNPTPTDDDCSFSINRQLWKINLFSGLIQIVDVFNQTSERCSNIVYRSNSSLEESIFPAFQIVEVSAIDSRVYLSALEREPGPIDDSFKREPNYQWKLLAFDSSAEGRLSWSFEPERLILRVNKERLVETPLPTNSFSIKTPVVDNPELDSINVELISPKTNSAVLCEIDATSGTLLSFKIL